MGSKELSMAMEMESMEGATNHQAVAATGSKHCVQPPVQRDCEALAPAVRAQLAQTLTVQA